MKKKIAILSVIFLILAVILCGCGQKTETASTKVKVSQIVIDESTVPTDATVGEVDVTNILFTVTYSDGKTENKTMTADMLTEESKEKLLREGTHILSMVYEGKTAKFQMKIAAKEQKKYTLRVYYGVPTAIDGVRYQNQAVLTGDYFESTYPEGSVITVQWVDDGSIFSYWTANDITVATTSIVNVTMDADYVYRAYSTVAVNTVSFVTYCDANLVSKTTNVLNSSDITAITKPGYLFSGWTTDEITEAQSLAGYSKNIVTFPYSVGRDIVFYAVWEPIGLQYNLFEDRCEVIGYTGSFYDLTVPATHLGLPVTALTATAFSGNAGILRSVTLPSSVTAIADGAFSECGLLERITVDSADFVSVDGVLFSKDGEKLIAYPANKPIAEYEIPSTVKIVAKKAFFNALCGSIVLPSSLERADEKAFDSCHIDRVDFSKAVPTGLVLADSLFSDSLSSLLFKATSKNLFVNSFPVLAAVKEKAVTERDALHPIGMHTYTESDGQTVSLIFRVVNDKNLVDESTLSVADKNAGNFRTAEIIGATRTVAKLALPIRFSYDLSEYYLSSVAYRAFADCGNLDEVLIPFSSRLKRICDDAFVGTPWVESLENDTVAANGVLYKYLGNQARYTVKTNISVIAEAAFKDNTSLEYFVLGNNSVLKTIAPYAFENCTSLVGFVCDANADGEGIYLKFAVENIGESAFRNTAITAVKAQASSTQQPSRLTSFGDRAFADCERLQSVTVTEATVDIATTAFIDCPNLMRFVCEEANPSFSVFDGILYRIDGEDYELYCYPAGRIDSVFNPAEVRNYGSRFVYNLSDYSSDTKLLDVGSIVMNGVKKSVYLTVKTEYAVVYDIESDTYLLQDGKGNALKPTTAAVYLSDGSLESTDGDYYFSIQAGDGLYRTVLLYDEVKDGYYYYPKTDFYATDMDADMTRYSRGEEEEVGSVSLNGATYALYFTESVGEDIGFSEGWPYKKSDAERLTQTTAVTYGEDGAVTVDGEFYYYVYLSSDKSKKTVLLYNTSTSEYYYTGGLNVVSVSSHAFSFSNVASVFLPHTVTAIGDGAFDIPGLVYLAFENRPVSSYGKIFAEAEPEYVTVGESVAVSEALLFFDNSRDLYETKTVSTAPYRFFYGCDDEGKEDASVLYGIHLTEGGFSVVRTARDCKKIELTDTVTETSGTVHSSKKTVRQYAFAGSVTEEVTLRAVSALASHAFSEATAMTKLFIETDFIEEVYDDTFGDKLNNGLYIYDNINSVNMYRSGNWDLTYFEYIDEDGTKWGARYLITDEEPYASVVYKDEDGDTRFAEIVYGKIDAAKKSELQDRINRSGYDISGFDGDGVTEQDGDTLLILSNQVLQCVWKPQTYTVYFVLPEGMKVVGAEEDSRNTDMNTVTYRSEVAYKEEYSFELDGFDKKRYVFSGWQDGEEVDYAYEGTEWSSVIASRRLTLYPVFAKKGYTLNFTAKNAVAAVAAASCYYGESYSLPVPVHKDGYVFSYWYMTDTSGKRIVLTDKTGNSLLAWSYGEKDDYDIIACWGAKVTYNGDASQEEDLVYGEYYTLSVIDNKNFNGWWYYDAQNQIQPLTDELGVLLEPWTMAEAITLKIYWEEK